MTNYLLQKFLSRAIDWVFRPKTPAVPLIKYGVLLAIATLGADYVINLRYNGTAGPFDFRFATGEGLPKWVAYIALGVALLMLLTAMALVVTRALVDHKREARSRLVIVEMRGLTASPDTSAEDADLGVVQGHREWMLLDFRPGMVAGVIQRPEDALAKLMLMPAQVELRAQGRDKRDIKVAIGGLAPVPLLFLSGLLLDDESAHLLFDWDRDAKVWKVIEGSDDGKRFLPVALDKLPQGTREVVLATSISYQADADALATTFGAVHPIVELTLEHVVPNCHWSGEKQIALTSQFRNVLAALAGKGVQRVHLVLAGPASLTIRMGMAYDRRLMPVLVVYQYERSHSPPYPWAIEMPSHGIEAPRVVYPPSTHV